MHWCILCSNEDEAKHNTSIVEAELDNVQLKHVYMYHCHFENDGSFDQMLEGCSRVERLDWLRYEHNWQCAAIANLMRQSSNKFGEKTEHLLPRFD